MNILRNIQRSITAKIRTKLLLAFSLVIISSVLFVTYFSITTYSKRLEQANIASSNQLLDSYVTNLNNYFSELDGVVKSVLYNYHIQRYLIEKSQVDSIFSSQASATTDSSSDYYQGSIDALYSIISLRPDIQSVFVHSNSGILLHKSRQRHIPLDEVSTYIEGLFPTGQEEVLYDISPRTYYTDEADYFSILSSIERYDGQVAIGTLQLDANLSSLQLFADSAAFRDQGAVVLLDDDGHTIHMSKTQVNLPDIDSIENILTGHLTTSATTNGYFISDTAGINCQYVYRQVPQTGWLLATVTPYAVIVSEATELRNTILLIAILSMLFILITTYFIANRITSPLIALKKSMDRADHNQLNQQVEVVTNDEIGDLTRSFNGMVTRIESLMDQVVNEQEEKRKIEIKVLQDQINPHFLYNTLDTIIWMTETEDENTVPMIEALSRLFRISLSKGQEMIPIEDELEHISHYLYILTFRYLDKFTYTIDADPALLSYKVPKIILQPLVENAIYHGIKNSPEKGLIAIKVYEEGDCLIMSITDSGIGMDADTCKKLLKGQGPNQSKSGSGVGVRNVDQRIKLHYGPDYGLCYESAEGVGTTVKLTLPLKTT